MPLFAYAFFQMLFRHASLIDAATSCRRYADMPLRAMLFTLIVDAIIFTLLLLLLFIVVLLRY